MKKRIEVAAAVIKHDNKYLCLKKGASRFPYIRGKYEFPGGKVESEEVPEQTVVREIKEELNMNITVKKFLLTVDHEYLDFYITLHSYLCTTDSIKLVLNEHSDFKWLKSNKLEDLNWSEADIPIVKVLSDEK